VASQAPVGRREQHSCALDHRPTPYATVMTLPLAVGEVCIGRHLTWFGFPHQKELKYRAWHAGGSFQGFALWHGSGKQEEQCSTLC
jgi:hypothetical protein